MSTPADFEQRWQRDRHVVHAQRETAAAASLVRSAAAKCRRDQRTTGADFEGAWAKLAELEDALASAIGAQATAHHPSAQQVLVETMQGEGQSA